MPLKASQVKTVEKRLKLFLYGSAGVGKTIASLSFPSSVVIDMEKGTENYSETISKAGSIVLQTVNPDEVKTELKTLLTEKHPYRTLIIDPVTSLYNGIQEKWTRIFEKHATSDKQAELQDFGMRYWGRVKNEYKTIQRLLMALDMNVIVTSHQKDIYGAGMQKIGVGPDSMKGDEYFFDYVFQLENVKGKRMAKTIKERSEIGKNKFPETFEWSYPNFQKFYGSKVLAKDSEPVALASPEQVAEIKRLVELVKIDTEEINKWFTKADCSEWEEMKADEIAKCIAYVSKKIQLKGDK